MIGDMNRDKVFAILDIEGTKDISKIKAAYRKQLVHHNPEDDPNGFMQLREAYEEAIRLASMKEPEAEPYAVTEEIRTEAQETEDIQKTPVYRWIEKVEATYHKLSSRIDVTVWEDLLNDDVCQDFETRDEAQDALLEFLMEHFRLPKAVWKLIVKAFVLDYCKEELYEKFPPLFIDFVIKASENETCMELSLFEGDEEADVDQFIDQYIFLMDMMDYGDYDEALEYIQALEKMDLYHPYLDTQKIKYHLETQNPDEAVKVAEKLRRKQYDDLYIRLILAQVSLEIGDLEGVYQECSSILKKDPDNNKAKNLLIDYYFESGEYKKAQEICLDILRMAPNNLEVHERLKTVNNKLIKLYQKEIKEFPEDKQLKLDLGWCLFHNHRYGDCIDLLKKITADEYSESEIYYNYCHLMSCTYLQMKNYKEAYPYVRTWINELLKKQEEKKSTSQKELDQLADAYYALSICLFYTDKDLTSDDSGNNRKEFKEYVKYIDCAINMVKDHQALIRYLLLKAYYLLDMKDYKGCIDVCDELIRLHNECMSAYIYRQESYYHLRMFKEVIKDYKQAIRIDYRYSRPYIFSVKAFLDQKQYEMAQEVLKQAYKASVDSQELKFQNLRLKMQTAQTIEEKIQVAKEMEALYQEVYKNPGDMDDPSFILYEITDFYYDIDDYEKALEAIEKRLSIKENEESLILKANILRELGRYKEAIYSYQKVLNTNAYNAEIYYKIGRCYRRFGEDEQAEEYFLKVIELNKQHQYAYGELMEIYSSRYKTTFDEEDYKLAIWYGKRQTEIYPTSYYYNILGLIYQEGYEFEKAIETFKEGIKCDETYMYSYNNIGYVYKILRNLEGAYQYYQLAIKYWDGRNMIPYENLAQYYSMTGEYEKAKEVYDILIKTNDTGDTTKDMLELAEVYMHMQQWEQALECYHMLYTANQIDEMIYLLYAGLAYCFIDPDKALNYHKMAIEKYPENDTPYHCMGDCILYLKGDVKEAAQYYEKAYQIIKQYNLDYNEFIESLQFPLLYTLKVLGRSKEILQHVEEIESFLIKNYGSIENWLKHSEDRKGRLFYLSQWNYFAENYDKTRYYMSQIKDVPMSPRYKFKEFIEYYLIEGFMLELEGDNMGALEKYEKVVKVYPIQLFYQYIVKEMRKKCRTEVEKNG